MPRISTVSWSTAFLDPISITSTPHLNFLLPSGLAARERHGACKRGYTTSERKKDSRRFERFFFSALSQAALCPAHRGQPASSLLRNGRAHRIINPSTKAKFGGLVGRQRSVHTGPVLKTPTRRRAEQHSNGGDDLHLQRARVGSEHGKSTSKGKSRPSSQFFDSNSASSGSHLPRGFYEDVEDLQFAFNLKEIGVHSEDEPEASEISGDPKASLEDQMKLLKSIRNFEEKLAKAKAALHRSLDRRKAETSLRQKPSVDPVQEVVLTKEDYLNLVDLYFYSHQSRFEPDSPDYSPTPLFLEDYSFKLSADFSKPDAQQEYDNEELDEDISPLQHVEEMLKSRQLHEIKIMRAFVELLLDDSSSNRVLFELYKKFPDPGVASLPRGVIRLFLQRMSTPWVKSEKTMLRYLSLIDDMQRASLPITSAEWSSAIYLAGRSFATVTESEVATSFRIWKEMEQKAGVKANHVTFNILFDIAVRAGKYVLGQTILKEMHDRGLRLNRLGRVSLIYYHGLRGDGDGVRKAYRDFIEAGEIVDTLVLNCVMASLINAQEPVAAEQVYERMKNLQARLRKGRREDSEGDLFMKYPPPGSTQIDMAMASNSLGRTLLKAARLRDVLPEHHTELQNSMPLTPDPVTFRTMIAHHASTSGDLDRLTVLINDMTELFELPITSLNFQLLFKGFAVHGGSRSDSAKWTLARLDLVWLACREAIQGRSVEKDSSQDDPEYDVHLPTIQEVDAEIAVESRTQALFSPRAAGKGPKKLGAWDEFIIDLTAYPRERLKPIHERKAPITLEGEESPFQPFFQAETDVDDGSAGASSTASPPADGDEYTLPSAMAYSHPHQPPEHNLEADSPSSPDARVRATRPLITWLLRAYQRVTNSRRKVEEVWFQIRRVWRPADAAERDAVVRVLRRALRDCDRLGNG